MTDKEKLKLIETRFEQLIQNVEDLEKKIETAMEALELIEKVDIDNIAGESAVIAYEALAKISDKGEE